MGDSVISNNRFSLRPARSSELSELVRIDDAAGTLYAQVGIVFEFGWDHPFAMAEAAQWSRAIETGLVQVAVDREDNPFGFIALEVLDGDPFIRQLSVHPAAMRRGIGSALVWHAIGWSGTRSLWLTTYSHVPWNAPFYARRFGFVAVPESECGPELKGIQEEERTVLPQPEHRTTMVRRPR